MTRCHSHVAFRYKRLMLCKYIESRPFKRDFFLTREDSQGGLVLGIPTFQEKRRCTSSRTVTHDAGRFVNVPRSLCPLSSTLHRSKTSREMNSQNEDRLNDCPTTTAREKIGFFSVNHVSTLAAKSPPNSRYTGVYEEKYVLYQFPYALVLREVTTPLNFTTSRLDSLNLVPLSPSKVFCQEQTCISRATRRLS